MADTRDEGLMEKETALMAELNVRCRTWPAPVVKAPWSLIHQDSFAADNQDEEYTLFGKAIKFAGLHGKEVRVIGTNHGNTQSI
jgi:hypothetical protein